MFWNQEFPDMLFMDSFRFIHYVVLETPLLYPLRFLNAAYSQLKYLPAWSMYLLFIFTFLSKMYIAGNQLRAHAR